MISYENFLRQFLVRAEEWAGIYGVYSVLAGRQVKVPENVREHSRSYQFLESRAMC